MAEQQDGTGIPTFKAFTGLRNDVDPERMQMGDLVDANNVDLDVTGRLSRRDGYARLLSGSFHSLFSNGSINLVVGDDPDAPGRSSMFALADDAGTMTAIRGRLTDNPFCYVSLFADRIYATNGDVNIVVDGGAARSWGIDIPVSSGHASDIDGGLAPGAYQWAITFIRDDDQESGASMPGIIDIGRGGIAFSDLPVSIDPRVDRKAIYLSTANGGILYYAGEIPNAARSTSFTRDSIDLQLQLETANLGPPPAAGHMLAIYRGHLFVAVGNMVFYSQPYAYELFDLRQYIPLDSRITLMATVDDGMYFSSETKTWFVSGDTPGEFRLNSLVANFGAVEGSMFDLDQDMVGDGSVPGTAVAWLGRNGGVCVCRNTGQMQNMTGARYRRTLAGSGAGIFIPKFSRYICSLPK